MRGSAEGDGRMTAVSRDEYRDLEAKAMTEAQLQTKVISLAKDLDWQVAHIRAAQKADGSWAVPYEGHVGLPDLILARGRRLIAVELKSQRGGFRAGQQEWLTAGGLGVNTFLWRPSDWLNGTVMAVLW